MSGKEYQYPMNRRRFRADDPERKEWQDPEKNLLTGESIRHDRVMPRSDARAD